MTAPTAKAKRPAEPQPPAEPRLSAEQRADAGRAARAAAPRASHREWAPGALRPDPVQLLADQNQDRVAWLVPLRHRRMSVSPFTFYRGTAGIFAADLAGTPVSGFTVQLGGDAHLSNFGAYASPSRQLVFDANDFDETLRGPWEWDLKRLATSFMIASEHLGFTEKVSRSLTAGCVKAYRDAMARFARMNLLDLWYEHMTTDDIRVVAGAGAIDIDKGLNRFSRKARSRTSLQALAKLTEDVDGRYRIRSDPPVLFRLRDLAGEFDGPGLEAVARAAFDRYKETLPDHHRACLDRFDPIDMAFKVVGVGSVGTRCFVILLEGRDRDDPLFLQVKEAGPSVLEEHLGASPYENNGQRVVEGQRLVQAESDIFLGWTKGDLAHREYYVRQLRDWKQSVDIEARATPEFIAFYGRLCGATLARGHARSGDAVAIASYAGKGDALDRAVADFSAAYTVQNRLDYDAFIAAIRDGRLEAGEPQIGS